MPPCPATPNASPTSGTTAPPRWCSPAIPPRPKPCANKALPASNRSPGRRAYVAAPRPSTRSSPGPRRRRPDRGHTPQRRRVLVSLDDDRLAKTQQILELERDLAHRVVHTPYLLLLAIPGINIVSVADLAGELGPIALYLNANAITGRAGLMPSRYQSDQVDCANGPLRRRGNRRLRAVLMQTADNLVQCNHYFRARADQWTRAGKDPRWVRVKVAKIFSRLAFAVVAGRQLFPHPCCQPRHYIVGKLLQFHSAHHTDLVAMRRDLEAAAEQLPAQQRRAEAEPLQRQLDALARRRGPQPLAELIPLVLARLAGRVVQSQPHESAGP